MYLVAQDMEITEIPGNIADEIVDKGFSAIMSPDNDMIYYSKYNWEDNGNRREIFSISAGSGSKSKITGVSDGYDNELLDVSPDGKYILFSRYSEGSYDLCYIKNNGSTFYTIASIPGE